MIGFAEARRLLLYEPVEYYAAWPFPHGEPEPQEIGEVSRRISENTSKKKSHRIFDPSRAQINLKQARRFIWWAMDKEYPDESNPGLAMICKEPMCVSPVHMVLGDSPQRYIPPKTVVQPESIVDPKEAARESRQKCQSVKIWYESRRQAEAAEAEMRARGARRQHAYPCDYAGCGGWHLTHYKPSTYAKKKRRLLKKKVGSW